MKACNRLFFVFVLSFISFLYSSANDSLLYISKFRIISAFDISLSLNLNNKENIEQTLTDKYYFKNQFLKADTFFLNKGNLKHKRNVRLATSFSLLTVAYLVNLYYLNEAWYKQYPKSSFHFYDDNSEWLQMDKAGHIWTSYQESIGGISLLNWCGVRKSRSETYGSFLGLLLQTPFEILDGMSEHWGFSLGDMYANLAGSLFAFTQAKLWHEQRISIKFSSHKVNYQNDTLNLADYVYGTNFYNRTLKDYNGQTYWLSINPRSFIKHAKFLPRWLNVAFGYGITIFNFYDIDNKYREFYFSLDVDFTKIPTKSKLLRTVFLFLNTLKVPCPTLEYNTKGNWKFHPFYF